MKKTDQWHRQVNDVRMRLGNTLWSQVRSDEGGVRSTSDSPVD